MAALTQSEQTLRKSACQSEKYGDGLCAEWSEEMKKQVGGLFGQNLIYLITYRPLGCMLLKMFVLAQAF